LTALVFPRLALPADRRKGSTVRGTDVTRKGIGVIVFDCPECGEEMEIPSKMAGRRVACVGCGVRVRVPESSRPRKKIKDKGLSGTQTLQFALLFFFVPVLSSILYYIWKADRPRLAKQINLLGFMIFGVQIVVVIGIVVLINVLAKK
jgi:hypothetical protein